MDRLLEKYVCSRRQSNWPWLAVFLSLSCSVAVGDEVRVKVAMQEAPYYVGEPVVIQFQVDGFDEQPEPTCEIVGDGLAKGLRGQLAAANPSVMSQIIQRNGQIYQSKRVTYQMNYLVTSESPGAFEIGPFELKQGNKATTVKAVSLSFQAVPLDAEMKIRLALPDKPIYPDQRVPVQLEWWYSGDFDKLMKLNIYSPLFDEFRFLPDEKPTRRTTILPIDTKEGRVDLIAKAREETLDGKKYVVLTASRTMVPQRTGEFTLSPISLTLRRATEFARNRRDDMGDFGFGGSLFRDMFEERRRPTKSELVRGVGEPLKIVVKSFPENRPESFAGAVGTDFAVDVTADRTVVRVGDPISLTISVRGNGNIENISLPPLSADGGMDPSQFRLPEGDGSGVLGDGVKQFQVAVRVADESVSEIPALAYSWFDPSLESFQTVRSKPIALRVMPAKVIGAGDVVSGRVAEQTGKDKGSRKSGATQVASAGASGDLRDQTKGKSATTVSESDGHGVDLSIDGNAATVLRDEVGAIRTIAWPVAVYVSGVAIVLIAWLDRFRTKVDSVISRRRKLVREQQARIARMSGRTVSDAIQEIASALRILVAEVPDVPREPATAMIAECEAMAYSPNGIASGVIDRQFVERARMVAEAYGA